MDTVCRIKRWQARLRASAGLDRSSVCILRIMSFSSGWGTLYPAKSTVGSSNSWLEWRQDLEVKGQPVQLVRLRLTDSRSNHVPHCMVLLPHEDGRGIWQLWIFSDG